MTRRGRRLVFVLLALACLGGAATLIVTAFEDTLVFFFSPTQLAAMDSLPQDRPIRVGGLVVENSVTREADAAGLEVVTFAVTDTAHQFDVRYAGHLPDLFREGQGVVAEGRFGPDNVFRADQVLAKHDENYMPPEVADALKEAGVWQGAPGAAPPVGGAP